MHQTLVESDSLARVQHVDLVQEVSELHHLPQLVLWQLTSACNSLMFIFKFNLNKSLFHL